MLSKSSLAVLVVAASASCSTMSSGVQGVSCTQDSDCGSGLRCLSESLPSDGGCSSVGKECLTLCQVTSDCAASLGSGYSCSTGMCGAAVLACQPEPTPTATDASADGPGE